MFAIFSPTSLQIVPLSLHSVGDLQAETGSFQRGWRKIPALHPAENGLTQTQKDPGVV